MTEQVFVVSRQEIFEHGEPIPEGFEPGDGARYLARASSKGHFVVRDGAETNAGLKQLIPYGMVTYGDQVFLMRRTREGAETRLHDRLSVGVGGHVNPVDLPAEGDRWGAGELLENALRRELSEELVVESSYVHEVVGVLNDDSDPVGQVHLGVVYRVSLDEPRAGVREVRQLRGDFVRVADLGRHLDRMESWSRHLVEHFWPPPPDNGLTESR